MILMSLNTRLGFFTGNTFLFLFFMAVIFVMAIMSSIGSRTLSQLSNQTNNVKTAKKWVVIATLCLWGALALSLFGIFLIPFIITWPYLFAFVIILVIIFNLLLATVYFFTANVIRNSSEYKSNNKNSVFSFNTMMGIGIGLILMSLILGIYTIIEIKNYNKQGGLYADAMLAAQVVPYIAPEYAPVANVANAYLQQKLDPMQQKQVFKDAQQATDYYNKLALLQPKYNTSLTELYQALKPEFAAVKSNL
jgi:MFS family permease